MAADNSQLPAGMFFIIGWLLYLLFEPQDSHYWVTVTDVPITCHVTVQPQAQDGQRWNSVPRQSLLYRAICIHWTIWEWILLPSQSSNRQEVTAGGWTSILSDTTIAVKQTNKSFKIQGSGMDRRLPCELPININWICGTILNNIKSMTRLFDPFQINNTHRLPQLRDEHLLTSIFICVYIYTFIAISFWWVLLLQLFVLKK